VYKAANCCCNTVNVPHAPCCNHACTYMLNSCPLQRQVHISGNTQDRINPDQGKQFLLPSKQLSHSSTAALAVTVCNVQRGSNQLGGPAAAVRTILLQTKHLSDAACSQTCSCSQTRAAHHLLPYAANKPCHNKATAHPAERWRATLSLWRCSCTQRGNITPHSLMSSRSSEQ
jgi:hypothetical protein